MGDESPGEPQKIHAICGGCTRMAVELAYKRYPWFRVIRGPLWLGMWLLSWWNGFDPDDYVVRNQACYDCIRFRKEVLWQRSRFFMFLNGYVAGPFGQWLGHLAAGLDEQDKIRFAQESTYHSLDEAIEDLQRELEPGKSTHSATGPLSWRQSRSKRRTQESADEGH